jgi:hypothetical protein
MAGRFPSEGFEIALTAAPYAVFHGFDDVFEGFADWFEGASGSSVHGHLFAPDKVQFHAAQEGYAGCLSTAAHLRDYNPEGFLVNLIWNTRKHHQSFLFAPRDSQGIGPFLSRDPNAVITAISGAWALPLLHSGTSVDEIRARAAELQQREALHLTRLRERRTRARVRIWTLAEALENPTNVLGAALEDILGPGADGASHLPGLKPIKGISVFLQQLRNSGMNPYSAGAVNEALALAKPDAHPARRTEADRS